MILKEYNKYIKLNIYTLLISNYLKVNIDDYIFCKCKIIENTLYIKLFLTKIVLRINNEKLHIFNLQKLLNTDLQIIFESIYVSTYKKEVMYILNSFIKYINTNIYSNITFELLKLGPKLTAIGVKGYILQLSGKITGARHKMIKIKQGVMKYTGNDADLAIEKIIYQIKRPSGTLGLIIKLLKPGFDTPGKINILHE